MSNRKPGIDLFRIIASVMVIGIHTAPFLFISKEVDQLTTLTLFRVAVPFFFMTTGYFLVGPLVLKPAYLNQMKVRCFILKISQIYVLSILLFLPLSVMNGTLEKNMTVFDMVKILLFKGSFYHLWYFPGIIIGLLLICLLLKFLSFNYVFLISSLLYVVGLGGDSFYGLSKQLILLEKFYNNLFNLMEMTRNGLFFVPLFLCLGAFLYQKKYAQFRKKEVIFLLILMLIMMMIESYLIHYYSEPRHDSMYLSLPLVMYFLFLLLLHWQPRIRVKEASYLSLLVYIGHPLVIVVVHFVSKKIEFVKISFIYFLLVCLGSFLLAKSALFFHSKFKHELKDSKPYRAERVLSVSSVIHNVEEIKKNIPERTKMMAVIKADAYGCDMVEYAKLLLKNNVNYFAVATIDEAIKLRQAMVSGEILILGYTDYKRIAEIKQYDLIQSIVSMEHARMLNSQKLSIRCHLQIDTGMHRLGITPNLETVIKIYQLDFLCIEGIYSHLGSSDALDGISIARTKQQLYVYQTLLKELDARKINYGITHIQSSYGILNYPDYQFDYVRAGIILFGFLSNDNAIKTKINLKPVIKIKAKLISKRWVEAGEFVGYGNQMKLEKEMLVGVLSIGYADGIPRSLSNNFSVFYQNEEIPQIGNICMDMMLVDLSNVEAIQMNDEVIIASDFKDIAIKNQTITNEILSQLGSRLGTSIKNY